MPDKSKLTPTQGRHALLRACRQARSGSTKVSVPASDVQEIVQLLTDLEQGAAQAAEEYLNLRSTTVAQAVYTSITDRYAAQVQEATARAQAAEMRAEALSEQVALLRESDTVAARQEAELRQRVSELQGELAEQEKEKMALVQEDKKLRQALNLSLVALCGSYDVTEWPANGESAQDKAIAVIEAVLLPSSAAPLPAPAQVADPLPTRQIQHNDFIPEPTMERAQRAVADWWAGKQEGGQGE